jgi:pSer/pThr/pTyr-binding forkhead associated (FHA) protein
VIVMRVILEITAGVDAGRMVSVPPGPALRVGRKAGADLVVAGDPTVSRLHFALEFDGGSCRLHDLGSTAGTSVNGERVEAATLRDGDRIQAGNTAFLVRIERPMAPLRPLPSRAAPVAAPAGPADPLHRRVWHELRQSPQPLFAILDAARDPIIYARLLECPERHQSLYEGIEGETLALVAPYLVALPPESPFLVRLIEEGWGKSWGVYLTSDRPFVELRKHLRRFLTVTKEGKELLFRFYDPRVLRPFLPGCSAEELEKYFGATRSFLVEGADPEVLLRFEREAGRLKVREVPLKAASVGDQVTIETEPVRP